jgi:hypothetical protein
MPTIALALLLSLLNPSTPPPPSPSLRLRVDIAFQGLPMPPRFAASAMDEVTHIWADYGVDIRALNPGDAVRDDAVRLSVVLANLPDQPTARGMLGSIPFLDDSPEPVILLYPGAIATLISGVRVTALPDHDWPYMLRDLIEGRVLGRALAHEIGHYLLRSRQHSELGLMRARQSTFDLVGYDRRHFTLSSAERRRLVSIRTSS